MADTQNDQNTREAGRKQDQSENDSEM